MGCLFRWPRVVAIHSFIEEETQYSILVDFQPDMLDSMLLTNPQAERPIFPEVSMYIYRMVEQQTYLSASSRSTTCSPRSPTTTLRRPLPPSARPSPTWSGSPRSRLWRRSAGCSGSSRGSSGWPTTPGEKKNEHESQFPL